MTKKEKESDYPSEDIFRGDCEPEKRPDEDQLNRHAQRMSEDSIIIAGMNMKMDSIRGNPDEGSKGTYFFAEGAD